MSGRFKRLPKKTQALHARLNEASFTLVARVGSGVRLRAEIPGTEAALLIEGSRNDWRLLSPTIRFMTTDHGDLSLAERFVELSTFPMSLSSKALASLDLDSIVAALRRDFALATSPLPIRVETGTLDELQRLVSHAAILHDARLWIVARSPFSNEFHAGAHHSACSWAHVAETAPIRRLLMTIAEHYRPFGQVVMTTTHGSTRRNPARIYGDPSPSPSAHDRMKALAAIADFVETCSGEVLARHAVTQDTVDAVAKSGDNNQDQPAP